MICHAAQDSDSTDAQIKALVKAHGNGTDLKLKNRLISMYKEDQAVRSAPYRSGSATRKLMERQKMTDSRLTLELERIVGQHGWPTITLVGLQASQDAAVILLHSPDHSFQRKLLPKLEKLSEERQIVGSDVATLVDKILIADGKPQEYGTQFFFSKGRGCMYPVKDPAHLDERRSRVLLPPMHDYKQMLSSLYRVTIDDDPCAQMASPLARQ